jgi:hypothetical protein
MITRCVRIKKEYPLWDTPIGNKPIPNIIGGTKKIDYVKTKNSSHGQWLDSN